MTNKLMNYLQLHFQRFGVSVIPVDEVREYYTNYCRITKIEDCIGLFDSFINLCVVSGYVVVEQGHLKLTDTWVMDNTGVNIING